MPSSIPPEIRVEAVRDDVTYALPVRPIGPLRWVGALLIGIGVLFLWTPINGLLWFVRRLLNSGVASSDWFGGLFNLPFLIGGLIPLGLGVLVIFGRCRVEWRRQRLSVLDHAGPIRWRRRFPREQIRALTVRCGDGKVGDKPMPTGPLGELGTLTAEFESGQTRVLAVGYPRDWLQAVAEDLSPRFGATLSTRVTPGIGLGDFSEIPSESADVTEKPANSLVRVEQASNGFLLVIPPTGLRRGSKGLFGFGLFWCLFIAVFTGLAGFSNGTSPPVGAWVLISVFWVIGLGMLAGAANMGRRRAMLQVAEDQLTVAQVGLFRSKRWKWVREELEGIRTDASGMKINGVPVLELQIHPVRGEKVGLFAGRDEQELRWMATELRRALQLDRGKAEGHRWLGEREGLLAPEAKREA